MANGHLETLDRMIADAGDKVDAVDYKTIADRYGRDFATWLLRQGYATRRSWRKSNTAAEGRRKATSEEAKRMTIVRDAYAKMKPEAQKALLANHPELVTILGIK